MKTPQSILRDAIHHLSQARTALVESKQTSLVASVDELTSDIQEQIKAEDRAVSLFFNLRHDARSGQ